MFLFCYDCYEKAPPTRGVTRGGDKGGHLPPGAAL